MPLGRSLRAPRQCISCFDEVRTCLLTIGQNEVAALPTVAGQWLGWAGHGAVRFTPALKQCIACGRGVTRWGDSYR
eukprot:749912-Prymnesium_polylepis.2